MLSDFIQTALNRLRSPTKGGLGTGQTSTIVPDRGDERLLSNGYRPSGFTLIEVLVVTGIVGILVSLLLPSLSRARDQCRGAACLSNLQQIGKGLTIYVIQQRDRYPQHSSPSTMSPRRRWPDYLHTQIRQEEVYDCPSLSVKQRIDFKKTWAHDQGKVYGGYGYNFQYLGNSRTGTALPEWEEPYCAPASAIRMPGLTIAVSDTRGSKKGQSESAYGKGGAAVYIVDPPLGSQELGSKGARTGNDPSKMWYEGGTDPASDEELWRSRPDDRHLGRVNVVFADGHGEPARADQLDGRLDGGPGDNRYYNGLHDARMR